MKSTITSIIILIINYHNGITQNTQLLHQLDNFNIIDYSQDTQSNLYCYSNINANIVLGTQSINAYGNVNGIIIKMDTLGNIIWATNLQDPTSIQNIDVKITRILYTSQNELWVCGQIKDTAIINNQVYTMTSGYRGFFIRLDPMSGNIIQLDIASNQYSSTINQLMEDNQGNIIFTGEIGGQIQFSNFTIGGAISATYYVKLDPARNLIWQIPLRTSTSNIQPGITSLHIDNFGNIISTIQSFNAANLIYGTNIVQLAYQNNLNHYMVLTKMGPSGQLLWQNQFDGFCEIKVNESEVGGNFYIHGYIDSLAIYQNTQLISQLNSNDLFIAKLNTNGSLIWHKTFGGSEDDEVRTLKKDNIGNLIFGGFFKSGFVENNITMVGNKSIFTSVLGSIDTLGNWNWMTQGSMHPFSNYIHNLYVSPGNNLLTFTSFLNYLIIPPPFPNYLFWNVSTSILNSCQLIHYLSNNINYITGKIFIDNNNNGIFDTGESGVKNIGVTSSSSGFIVFTNSFGDYSLISTPGSHIVQLTTIPNNYTVTTNPLPSINFLGGGQNSSGNNIGISAPTGLNDLSTKVTAINLPRFYQPLVYSIEYKNEGSMPQNVSLNFTIPVQLNFLQSNPIPNTINGTTYSWFIPNLLPLESNNIEFISNFTLTSYNWNDTIYTTSNITPVLNDINPQDNQYDDSTRIYAPYDPNFKNVSKNSLTIQEISGTCWLNYIIHFQNLGNDTAFHVIIKDTLSSWIDLPNLEITGTSDPVELEVDNWGRATFKFYNIMLPDSGTDFAGSCGFVKYRALLKPGLQSGDVIENLADIYFDYMPPIRTNTVATFVSYPVNNDDIIASQQIKIYPNPTEGRIIYFECKNGSNEISWEIIDPLGRIINKGNSLRENMNNRFEIELDKIESGLYYLKLELDQNVHFLQVILK